MSMIGVARAAEKTGKRLVLACCNNVRTLLPPHSVEASRHWGAKEGGRQTVPSACTAGNEIDVDYTISICSHLTKYI